MLMKQLTVRSLVFLLLLPVVAVLSTAALASPAPPPPGAWVSKTDAELLTATDGGAAADFLIVMTEQPDLRGAARPAGKTDRGRYVYETMTAVAARTQAPVRALLDRQGIAYRAYWVANMIAVRGDRTLLQTLASRDDVRHIYANRWQRVGPPAPVPISGETRRPTLVEWNIEIVNAPDVWAAGFTGQGVVIGGQDTGYDWQHPALVNQYRGWNGSTADHNYNWHDAIHEDNPLGNTGTPGNPCGYNSPTPCDDDGHGTHTMGTMVGETPQLNIGMAPDAEWIGCRNMEEGWGTPTTYAECYEWFIAPYPLGGDPFTDGDPARAPHVINNSWGCPPVEGCVAADVLQQVVESVRAAGIVTVHSAGNSGSGCGSIDQPGGIYDASFTVGATDDQNTIAAFSSRGPVIIDGSNRLKPDIVAPGVDIHSSIPNNKYAFLSGTSMAAPHVAGLVALLISAEPSLAGRVNTLENLVTQSAMPRTTSQGCGHDEPNSVPNNVYGWGRIDALAAYELLDTDIAGFHVFVPVLVPR